MLHFLKDCWKFIQIHTNQIKIQISNPSMALMVTDIMDFFGMFQRKVMAFYIKKATAGTLHFV